MEIYYVFLNDGDFIVYVIDLTIFMINEYYVIIANSVMKAGHYHYITTTTQILSAYVWTSPHVLMVEIVAQNTVAEIWYKKHTGPTKNRSQ